MRISRMPQRSRQGAVDVLWTSDDWQVRPSSGMCASQLYRDMGCRDSAVPGVRVARTIAREGGCTTRGYSHTKLKRRTRPHKAMFGDLQMETLADIIQTALMLRINKRTVG